MDGMNLESEAQGANSTRSHLFAKCNEIHLMKVKSRIVTSGEGVWRNGVGRDR